MGCWFVRIAFFAPIEEYDLKVEKAKGGAKLLTWVGLGLSVAGFLMPLVFFLGFLGVPLLIVGVIFWARMGSKDVPNTLRNFILPWMTVLREEMQPEVPVNLKLDLTDLKKHKVTSSEKVPTRGARERSRKLTVYQDPWFSCSSTLVDQSRLRVEILDIVKKTDVTKRSASGKTKFKSKQKGQRQVSVSLTVANKRYALPNDVRADGKWKTKSGEKRGVLACRRVFALPESKDRLEEWMVASDIMALVSEVYRRAQPIPKSA